MKLELKTLKKCSGIIICAECPFEIHKHKVKVRSVHRVEEFFFSSSHTQLLRRPVVGE